MNKIITYLMTGFGMFSFVMFSYMLYDMAEGRSIGLTMGPRTHANTDTGALVLMSMFILMALLIMFMPMIIKKLNK